MARLLVLKVFIEAAIGAIAAMIAMALYRARAPVPQDVASPVAQVLSPAVPSLAQNQESKRDAARGATIFAQNCAACHGARGQGGVGPSLIGESARKNFAQAVAWIKHPKPPMSALYRQTLNESDVRNVAAFVDTLK